MNDKNINYDYIAHFVKALTVCTLIRIERLLEEVW